jgi:DNA polymerase/3'-5' exonuclease PolX
MEEVKEVWGIGDKKAQYLKRVYGIRTVRALEQYARKMPNIISEAQRVGLKYHSKISKPVPRAQIAAHVKYLEANVKGAIVAGSWRREEPLVGDIDVVVTAPLHKVVKQLIDARYIVAMLGEGEERFSGVAHLGGLYRKIDIIRTTPAERAFALVYFTGDLVQNVKMRRRAKQMGYTLSQHGLRSIKTGKDVSLSTERDIFAFLKMPYVEPPARVHKAD